MKYCDKAEAAGSMCVSKQTQQAINQVRSGRSKYKTPQVIGLTGTLREVTEGLEVANQQQRAPAPNPKTLEKAPIKDRQAKQ